MDNWMDNGHGRAGATGRPSPQLEVPLRQFWLTACPLRRPQESGSNESVVGIHPTFG